MSNPKTVLSVDHLSKRYILGGPDQLNTSFREMLMGTLTAPFKRYRNLSGNVDESQLFWALEDINFQVSQGEVVGIIGKNGAGKSTLLKILSRITTPTKGSVTIRGNVASLLEVGTGFHPELTGRENIYLNGAILGMQRKEINAKFDKIVEFANIEKFVDTPVKRYSSGMYVRLAFSIAAHLEPDILIVDEVLAVGDVEFQKRCLGKLSDIATEGRTVLFVSHNMNAINRLCERCILLEDGEVAKDADVHDVVQHYLRTESSEVEGEWVSQHRDKSLPIEFIKLSILNDQLKVTNVIPYNESFAVKLNANVYLDKGEYIFGLSVTDLYGNHVFVSHHYDKQDFTIDMKNTDHITLLCEIPKELLRPGEYTLAMFCHEKQGYQMKFIRVVRLKLTITNIGCNINQGRLGIISPKLSWEIA